MEGERVAGEVSILRVDEGVGALVVDATLMARRVSVGSEHEPVVSLVRDDYIHLIIVIAGVTYRCFGNIEFVELKKTRIKPSCIPVLHFINPCWPTPVGKDKS